MIKNKTDLTIKSLRGPSEDVIIRWNVVFYNRKKTRVKTRDTQRTQCGSKDNVSISPSIFSSLFFFSDYSFPALRLNECSTAEFPLHSTLAHS